MNATKLPTIKELEEILSDKDGKHDQINDRNISYHESKHGGAVARFVRFLTRWAWKYHVRNPINRMYERGLINSFTYHEAHDYATRIIYGTKP